jgi:hypothetical protein
MNSLHLVKSSSDKFTQTFCLYEIHINQYKGLKESGKFLFSFITIKYFTY